MKLTINSRVLKSALESANKGINPKPNIPTLANFLLEGNGSYLTITGSDGNTTIKETIPCETEGKALLPTNLLELVRTLPEGDITIETEDTTATILWKNGKSTIPAFPVSDYPEIKDYEGEYLAIKGDTFASALSHTLPHTADDELRPVMAGVFFNAKEDGTIDIVASDSHTLGLYTIKADHKEPFNFVAPANALKLVSALAKVNDVEIANDDASIYFRIGTTTIQSRKIVGKFPKYESVIPKTFTSTLTAEKALLLNSIKRVSVCANKASGHIKLSLGMLATTIEAQDLSLQTSAREDPEGVTYEGADLAIGFKGEYLVRCISAIESTEVQIKFNDPYKAAVVTSDEDAGTMIIMPIKV